MCWPAVVGYARRPPSYPGRRPHVWRPSTHTAPHGRWRHPQGLSGSAHPDSMGLGGLRAPDMRSVGMIGPSALWRGARNAMNVSLSKLQQGRSSQVVALPLRGRWRFAEARPRRIDRDSGHMMANLRLCLHLRRLAKPYAARAGEPSFGRLRLQKEHSVDSKTHWTP